ncbi:DUF5372 family protein [Paracoccus sp. MKU1]|uniref:DUF5372 family protein n=1 Tax=Paracoccus sp. MKU1 TaxID=1745182 RepID=UPI00071933F8|nr:DUF5372 family protein [Paracoccus sp. MKU1]KRW97715.1 hypothetical protein AQY21_02085 [Paracoccus sp. MKU1]
MTLADEDLVLVTHPFHPLFAQQLPCVGRRYNRHGERLLLQAGDAVIWSVPPQWTDLAGKDPELVMGEGRAVLRFSDLMELADLVGRVSDKSAQMGAKTCKGNYAAIVRRITPQERQGDM